MIDLKPHLENIDHVVWDWNGTLFNDVESVMVALSSAMESCGLTPISRQTYLEKFKFPVIDFYKEVGFDFDQHDFQEVSEQFHQTYDEHIHLSGVFEKAEETLAFVKSIGLKQSVLTAAFQGHINQWLGQFNLKHFFDHAYGLGDKLAHSKVERGRELLETSNITPARTLIIGDTDHDLEVGKSLGANVILLGGGHQHVDRLKSKHTVVLDR